MKIFDFFKKKDQPFSAKEVEKEYNKAQQKIQAIDSRQCFSLVRDMKRYAETLYAPKADCDLLRQKSEFMRVYAFRAYQWRLFYTLNHKEGKLSNSALWTKKWRDYEQGERLQAQKEWKRLVQKYQLTQKVR